MEINDVPQDENRTLAGQRKAMYARDADGRIVLATSCGWEAEEIVTLQAVETLQRQADAALTQARAGKVSPLAYWMYVRRMDETLLAQASGIWCWRVRRHLRPEIFSRLKTSVLARYAIALDINIDTLKTLP